MAAKKSKKKATRSASKKKTAKKKALTKKAAKKKSAPKKKAKAAPKKKAKAAPKKKTVAKAVSKAAAKPSTQKASATTATKTGKATTTIVQHVFIQATPEQVFDALVQPAVAASIIGGECTGEPTVGATYTHWNGYIIGKHLELVRGERIAQEWTTTEWPKGAAPSRLELQLVGTGGGTELTMTHSNVPSEQAEEYRQGWIDYYWTPMRAHFGG